MLRYSCLQSLGVKGSSDGSVSGLSDEGGIFGSVCDVVFCYAMNG